MKTSRLAYELGLKLQIFEKKKILIAFSGGLDSSVLLEVLFELKHRYQFELAIAHIHHGDSVSSAQKKYRDQALEFARKKAAEKNCQFFFDKNSVEHIKKTSTETKNPSSEATLRKMRSELLEKIRSQNNFDYVAYAHHAQDLFETRLIRLIRGTGQNGLEAMKILSEKKLRPMLETWPKDILSYAYQNKIEYLVDPSNADVNYMRNWLRHKWLRDLEEQRPGSIQAFARSLELLQQNSGSQTESDASHLALQANEAGISREQFKLLSRPQRSQIIASYLRSFSKQNYSSNKVAEICKRLDTSQKQLKFTVAGLEWTANAKQIRAREIE